MSTETKIKSEIETDTAPDASDTPVPRVETPFQRFRSELIESRIAMGALVLQSLIIVLALLAPWITPQDPYDLGQVDVLDGKMAPGAQAFAGYTMWLGSDGSGRDLYSAILCGLRISLTVGVASGFIALVIGSTIGLIAAYAGGRVDTIIMRLVDLQLSFPAALIALILVAIMGRGIDKIIIALVAAQWAYYARTVRATALVESAKEYMRRRAASASAMRGSSSATCCRTVWRR